MSLPHPATVLNPSDMRAVFLDKPLKHDPVFSAIETSGIAHVDLSARADKPWHCADVITFMSDQSLRQVLIVSSFEASWDVAFALLTLQEGFDVFAAVQSVNYSLTPAALRLWQSGAIILSCESAVLELSMVTA